MTTSTDPDLTPDYALVLELAGASVAMPEEEFAKYAARRLKPLLREGNVDYLTDVITLASTMTGGAIQCWAEDTDRTPETILGLIRREFNEQTGD